ncbi:acyl carrier protein [Nannocystis sp. RBIL2]|uniref:acyl carrier protein n=1 Tax=Nannocystis sp. RBIL2 TaxID=2996788 RepID=UPI00226FA614|nr:acyl carrier protein [Nannocystis sp. RBIL2]MCY1071294.1 acyl carrier protein [Nannocystis sp. RBIL2]
MSTSDAIEQALKQYVAREILDGKDIGLDADTPLLEWGVINSLEIARLLGFVREQFGVVVPLESVTAEHFKDLRALTALVASLKG